MSYTTNIYEAMRLDFLLPQYKGKTCITRTLTLENRLTIIFYLYKEENIRQIAIELPDGYNKDEVLAFPKWKGMEQKKCVIGGNQNYIVFEQSHDYEAHIYDLVIDDLIYNIRNKEHKEVVRIIGNILIKWKNFFQALSEIIISEMKQQGLYAELMFLERLVNMHGVNAINFWVGSEPETHDFYINRNAIEVKSYSSKAPYKVNINNEYQLDNNDVIGNLYILFMAFRRSKIDGECLPDVVSRIKALLNESPNMLEEFINKLFKSGYLVECPEIYKVHFSKRDELVFKVKDDFPKLTRKNLPHGIGTVEYILSLDACSKFLVTDDSFYYDIGVKYDDN